MSIEERQLIAPDHLGDGVYIHDNRHELILAVNHHENKVIYMDEYVVKAFVRYAKRAGFDV